VLPTALRDLRGVWRLLGPTSRQRAVLRPARPPSGPSGATATPDAPRTTPGDGRAGRLVDIGNGWRGDTTRRQPAPPVTDGPGVGRGRGSVPPVFTDELLRFAGVGAVSSVAYVGMFAILEPSLGSYTANAVAIGLCSLGNTATHRGMAGSVRHGLDRNHRLLTASALLGISLAFTTGALAVTRATGATSLLPELCAVSIANAGAAVIRFTILRTWVFRPEFGTHLAVPPAASTDSTPEGRTTEWTRTPS
jgi:hypothetical protein